MKPIKLFFLLMLGGLLANAGGFAAEPATTRTESAGGVTIKVTLLDTKTDDDLRFQMSLDTHSVNLDSYDLKTISVLRDEAGNTFLPTTVESKDSGHHRQAVVTFGKISPRTKRVELVLKDVAGIKERVFRWDLESGR